jgi:hypothetical protein
MATLTKRLLSEKTAALVAVALAAQLATRAAEAAVLTVPTSHATIQAAVEAAAPGDTIKILPGIYVEQVSIGKNLKLMGSGAASTIIKAPASLQPGQDGDTQIVEVFGGASVTITKLAVKGPGSGTCDSGALTHGIHALPGTQINVSYASVTSIRDAVLADCFRSGNAILAESADVDVDHTFITDFQAAAIIVLFGTAKLTHNVIVGPGPKAPVATDGIGLIGSPGTIAYNVVSGIACPSPDLGCGPDFFNEFQLAGIGAGGPGTVITRNLLINNQIGIYVGEEAELSENLMVNNDYFGIALQDGTFTSRKDVVIGGVGGVAVIAGSVDTTASLDKVKIRGTSGPKVQEFECCGFTATVIGGP